MLSKFLEREYQAGRLLECAPEDGTDRASFRAVELGAGCGLVSLVLARLLQHWQRASPTEGKGPFDIVATEADNLRCLDTLSVNARRCFPPAADAPAPPTSYPRNFGPVTVTDHNWGAELSPPLEGHFDYVIGAEIMYDPETGLSLLASIRRLCHSRSRVLMSYGRNRSAEQKFKEAAAAYFTVVDISEQQLHPDFVHPVLHVLELRPLPGKFPEIAVSPLVPLAPATDAMPPPDVPAEEDKKKRPREEEPEQPTVVSKSDGTDPSPAMGPKPTDKTRTPRASKRSK
ncbi:hypothetical protein H696_04918 [Fonticula alba]|uniref:Uncharacterized protein n=1 Tax=Fonticula alba TaxID=691883 RepID=A0A058Z532_FONAL|nr:hypothetical protein H696_04918 [Fonticula alba]KCV68627.1 hypothetical protein H696_04918 [Fonticula alba]|eukprot:XP_009497059.1 hypothetical protein H696_04918 [Fonticula alba]